MRETMKPTVLRSSLQCEAAEHEARAGRQRSPSDQLSARHQRPGERRQDLRQDVAYAARALLRQPAFTVAAASPPCARG